MVAGGDGVHAAAKQFLGDVRRDAVAAGGIFAVGDDDVETVRLSQLGQEFLDRAPAWRPDDVADEQNFHAGKLTTKDTKDTKESKPRIDTNEHELVGTARCAAPRRRAQRQATERMR